MSKKIIFVLAFLGVLFFQKPLMAASGNIPLGIAPSPVPSLNEMMSLKDSNGGVQAISGAFINSSSHSCLGVGCSIDSDPSGIYGGGSYVLSVFGSLNSLSNDAAAIVGTVTATPTANSTATFSGGLFSAQSSASSTFTTGGLNGIIVQAFHENSQNQGRVQAVNVGAGNESTGTVTHVTGVGGTASNDGTGTVSKLDGADFALFNDGNGIVTTGIGALVESPTNTGTGTVGTMTGVSIQDQGATGITTSYNLDSAASSATYNIHATGTSKNLLQGATAIGGTTTNDSAASGFVGEYVNSTVAVGSGVVLSNATPANVTSISLTAGDWSVVGQICFNQTSALTATLWKSSVSATSATDGVAGDTMVQTPTSPTSSADNCENVSTVRESLSATTSIFLVADASFSAGGAKAYGRISARRVR